MEQRSLNSNCETVMVERLSGTVMDEQYWSNSDGKSEMLV